MEKENWDPDFQPPRKKAKRTKVAIDKRFAEAKRADEVAEITKGYVLLILPGIPPGLCEYSKSGVVLGIRNVLVMNWAIPLNRDTPPIDE